MGPLFYRSSVLLFWASESYTSPCWLISFIYRQNKVQLVSLESQSNKNTMYCILLLRPLWISEDQPFCFISSEVHSRVDALLPLTGFTLSSKAPSSRRRRFRMLRSRWWTSCPPRPPPSSVSSTPPFVSEHSCTALCSSTCSKLNIKRTCKKGQEDVPEECNKWLKQKNINYSG